MNKKSLLTLIIPALLLTGCQIKYEEHDEEADNITLTDLLNREVSFDRNSIKKVVCIGAGALRLYSYIGDINLIAGVEDIDRSVNANIFEGASRPYFDLNKDYFKTLPSIGLGGPTNQVAEPEKIIEVEPDLIISEYEDVKKADDLQDQLHTPVLVTSYGGSNVFSEQIKKSLTMLGKALKKEERAEQLINCINSSKLDLENKVKDINQEDAPKMYVGCLGNWGRQSFLSSSKQYPAFAVSKINNAASGLKTNDKGLIDLEELIEQNPDKIILDAAGVELFKQDYLRDPTSYQAIDAIKNGEIYLQMAFNAYYTNLEIALMNCYYVASVAYPSLYEGFDIAKKSNEITKAFLGEEMYDSSIKQMRYSYGGYQKIDNLANFGE